MPFRHPGIADDTADETEVSSAADVSISLLSCFERSGPLLLLPKMPVTGFQIAMSAPSRPVEDAELVRADERGGQRHHLARDRVVGACNIMDQQAVLPAEHVLTRPWRRRRFNRILAESHHGAGDAGEVLPFDPGEYPNVARVFGLWEWEH